MLILLTKTPLLTIGSVNAAVKPNELLKCSPVKSATVVEDDPGKVEEWRTVAFRATQLALLDEVLSNANWHGR